MIDCCKEISGATDPFDRILTAFVSRSNEASGFNAASGPDVREGPRPVVTARLFGSGWCAGVSGTGAWLITDLWSASEFAGHNYQHSFVEASVIDIFDQCRNGLVVGLRSESHGVKDVMIDGVVVPVVDSATKRAAQAGRQYFNAGLNETTCEQQLLAP